MTTQGYLRPVSTAAELSRSVAVLEAAGVAADDTVHYEWPEAVLETLSSVDTLVVRTFSGTCGLRRAADLLRATSDRGDELGVLDEGIDASVPPADWASAAGILRGVEWRCLSDRARASERSHERDER